TVTAATDSKTYDGDTTSSGVPTITSGTLAGGDSATWTQTFDNKNVGASKTLTPAGTVTDGNSGANYSVTFTPVTTGTITARAITVTAVTDAKVYDGDTTSSGAPTITSGTLAGGDTATWTQTFDSKNVDTSKTLTPAGTVTDGNSGGNYSVTFAPVTTGTIAVRTLTVTGITAFNKVYDGTATATLNTGSAVLVGVAVGDDVTLSVASAAGAFVDSSVGTGKTVTISGLTIGGADAANYTLTQPTTTANIVARALTVTDPPDGSVLAPSLGVISGTVTVDSMPSVALRIRRQSDGYYWGSWSHAEHWVAATVSGSAFNFTFSCDASAISGLDKYYVTVRANLQSGSQVTDVVSYTMQGYVPLLQHKVPGLSLWGSLAQATILAAALVWFVRRRLIARDGTY
ncbi:MAG: YDG domain-containing protein, partial [Chloroflexi bacterium]|nr:YDG domain-containing protein [Chloroflexota bacterium]